MKLLLTGIVVVVLVAIGAWIYSTDRAGAKIRQKVESFAEWTPENISGDPEGYLYFCKEQTEQAITKLKASEIAISQNRAKLLGMKENADHKVRVGEEALGELKSLYAGAEEDGKWPASWRDQPRTRDWTQKQIVGLHKQVKQQDGLSEKCMAGIDRCDQQLEKAKRLQAEAGARLGEIRVSQQTLEIDQLSKGLEEQLVTMRSTLQSFVGKADNFGADAPLDLDEMAGAAGAAVDQGEFEAIMGEPSSSRPDR